MARLTDTGISIFLSIILIFLFTAFDETVGTLYLILILLDLAFQVLDKYVSIKFEENENGRLFDFALAIGTFFGFLVIIQYLNSLTGQVQSVVGLQSSLQLLSTTVPLLKGNKLTQIIAFAFVIGTIETLFVFGRVLEAVLERFIPGIIGRKPDLFDLTDWGTWLGYLTVAAIFTIIHVQTRLAQDIPLLITFVFGILECVLVAISRNLRSAVLLHIINNLLSVLIALKLISLT